MHSETSKDEPPAPDDAQAIVPPPRDPVAAPPRRRLLADLTPLRTSADFRRLWIGNTISWVGQGMTALAISLQVYDLTHSSFSVGLVGLFSLVPLVVFGLYGGAIADTVDRRLLGLASSTGSWLLAVALAVAAFAGFHQVWFLYAVVALQAVCAALNSPARTSMIPRLLPAEQLPAANALNSMTTTFGTMTGPMLGGALVGLWGYQAAYLIDAVAFTAALYAMWRLPAMRPEREEGSRGRASVLDGLRFLATRPNIRMTFFTDLCAMVLAHPRALFPAVAVVWYGGDAKTAGLLVAAPAVGALLGSVFSGWLGSVHRHGVAILLAVGGWGLAVAVFGLTRNLWLGLLFLALAGAADAISMVFRSTMLQAATPDAMRGRLQGVFIVVVAGGPRLGDFLAGSVGDLVSPTAAVTGGGLLCVLAVTALGLRWRNFARYDARDPQP
ncbi:MFS transporter [Streptomyces koyangensis]|uniref:MFS transporter n=1 Tax=Streptomyces koyangensis TaxID=188770 RepID=A0A385DG81_9ACTN|nr:MFS transporter [Streptomyces koyangensis]PKR46750.1 MFS transporter [Streptomyces sp. EAG2]